jgi:hypothetical protein
MGTDYREITENWRVNMTVLGKCNFVCFWSCDFCVVFAYNCRDIAERRGTLMNPIGIERACCACGGVLNQTSE